MHSAPTPINEASRIATLRLLQILDTQPEERFDRLTRMARRLFGVAIARVTLVDSHRQWFKSSAGSPLGESSRATSFCGHAILANEILLVTDATEDVRFVDNPLVLGDPHIRFYAGCPLKVAGHNLGTLCLIDDKVREFTDEEHQLLKDLAEMAERELAAVQLSITDHLTGLSNRRGFELLGCHTLSVCTRLERPATLLLFDLDGFKTINDTYGHTAGDDALRIFAQGLINVFRDSDVLGRLGGDEFAVLLTGTVSETARIALDRLGQWLSDRTRREPGYEIQFSAGQVQFEPSSHASLEALLEQADSAMYENKRQAMAAQ